MIVYSTERFHVGDRVTAKWQGGKKSYSFTGVITASYLVPLIQETNVSALVPA